MKKSNTAATAPTSPHHELSFFKPKIKSGSGAKYKKKNAKNEPPSIAPKKILWSEGQLLQEFLASSF
jgi:hypothetical protein